MRFTIFGALILSLLSLSARAGSHLECRDAVFRAGAFQVQVLWSEAASRCWLSLTPASAPDLVYRSFILSDEGELLVFNSYGGGPSSQDTGAREFYLFPRGGSPRVISADGKLLGIELSGTRELWLDSESQQVLNLTGTRVSQSNFVDPSNRGGIELEPTQGLLLDVGFRLGGAPHRDLDATSDFVDARGARCAVYNRELFTVQADGRDELRFADDSALRAYLSVRCPGISF